MACLPQLGSVPAAYASSLAAAIDLSDNDVIALRPLRRYHQLRYVSYVPYVVCFPCVALDGNPA